MSGECPVCHHRCKVNNWKSVEDGLPEQGKLVDVWTPGGRVTDAWWDREKPGSDKWFWATHCAPDMPSYGVLGGITELSGVTHWMFIPEAPTCG